MAKISIDVEEIKKGLKTRALQAAAEISDLADRAKKDLTQEKLLKKVDEVMTIVRSQEFMKNPKVAELATKIIALSGQIEKAVTENVVPVVDEMRARVKAAADMAVAKASEVASTATRMRSEASKTSAASASSTEDGENLSAAEEREVELKTSAKTTAKKTAAKKGAKKSNA